MAVFGIVSEFNPFHNGHKYLIDQAREMGADGVVCVMSPNATQRGELAITDKYNRAEMAIRGGADIVLELPYPFCSASAECFASRSVFLLSKFCDTLIFGSECGDITILSTLAEYAASAEFDTKFKSRLAEGAQSAAAYLALLREKINIPLCSNDLLGIQYIKAAKIGDLPLSFITVKRSGSTYLESELGATGFDSAMALREAINTEREIERINGKLPAQAFSVLVQAKKNGDLCSNEKYKRIAHSFFRLHAPEYVSRFAECEGGIAERICRLANESESGEEFISGLSTKRYTDAKLRRAILFALTSVTKDDLNAIPEYTLLLGAGEKGRSILSSNRKKENAIKIITKPSDTALLSSEAERRQTELSAKLDAIYTLCLEKERDSAAMLRKKPYIT